MIGLLWIFFERFGLTVLSVIATFWYAKLLGPEGYGYAAILLAAPMMVSGLIDQIQHTSILANKRERSSVYDTSLKCWFVVSLIVACLTYLIVTYIYKDAETLHVMLAIAYLPLSSVSRVFIADLVSTGNFKAMALRSFWGKFIGLTVGVSFSFFGFPVLAILCQNLVNIAVSLLMMLYSTKLFNDNLITLRWRFNWREFLMINKDGIPSGVRILDQNLKSYGLILLIGSCLGEYSAGIFSIAIKVVDIVKINISNGLSMWSMGKFYMTLDNKEDLSRAFLHTFMISVFILLPSYIGLALVSSTIIEEFIGLQWAASGSVIYNLAVIGLISTFFLLIPSLQVVTKTTYNTLAINVFSSVLVVSITLGLYRFAGLDAAIYALLISTVIPLPKYSKELYLILEIRSRELFIIMLPALFSSIAMYGFSIVLNFGLVLTVCTSITIYLLLMLMFFKIGILNNSLILEFLEKR